MKAASADSMAEATVGRASTRGVAQDYLVAPSGGELTAQMQVPHVRSGARRLGAEVHRPRAVRARGAMVAVLEARARRGGRFSAEAAVVHRRETVAERRAVPLRTSAVAQRRGGDRRRWRSPDRSRRRVDARVADDRVEEADRREFLAFDDRRRDRRPRPHGAERESSAFLTELAVQTSALFHEPSGHWGALGRHRLRDSGAIHRTRSDHRARDRSAAAPRLSRRHRAVARAEVGPVRRSSRSIDRGDAANPATRLPILDGGFDQKQIMFGVTRHIDAPRHHRHDDDGDAMIIGSR